jgi:hypothetical protein
MVRFCTPSAKKPPMNEDSSSSKTTWGRGWGFYLQHSSYDLRFVLLWPPLLVPILLPEYGTKLVLLLHLWLHFFWFFSRFWDLNSGPLRAWPLSHSTSPFLWRFFGDKVSQNYLPGWLRTAILISASWVASIAGLSQQHPTKTIIFFRGM